jgi:hypothetical protein
VPSRMTEPSDRRLFAKNIFCSHIA